MRRKVRMKPLKTLMIFTLLMLLAGCGEQTPQEKLAKISKDAALGSAEAQAALAWMYLRGEGVPKDATKALEWYEKAATQGYAKAQAALAWMYLRGEGVPKDATKAFEWIQKAVVQGNAEGQDVLGAMYQLGEGVPKDTAKAREWFEKAATQGLAEAQYNLGYMNATGEGVPKDATKAFEWYEKAATQGYAKAQNTLGWIYFQGEGVPKDAGKAREWFEKAAAQGDAIAQDALGSMYWHGEGVPKDAATAFEWYEKAATQGLANAQGALGWMYWHGEGVPKDAAKAREWFEKAAAQGDAVGQWLLGQLYERGDGTEKDLVLAYAWYNLAAARSDNTTSPSEAASYKRIRDDLERELTTSKRAEGQRLASNWKPGTLLARENVAASGGPSKSGKGTVGAPIQGRTGTGFVVSGSGHILTTFHVVKGYAKIRISGRKGAAKLLVTDSANDLALLQIPGETKDFARLTPEPSKLKQGEDIVVYGYPLNAVLSSGGNLSPGVVSAMTGLGNNTNQIQITPPIQPGSSGSPVLNKKGHVVGIVSMKLSELKTAMATGSLPQNVNFAVNAQTVRSFLDAHKVPYKTGSSFFATEKSTADLAEEARRWTVIVECWK